MWTLGRSLKWVAILAGISAAAAIPVASRGGEPMPEEGRSSDQLLQWACPLELSSAPENPTPFPVADSEPAFEFPLGAPVGASVPRQEREEPDSDLRTLQWIDIGVERSSAWLSFFVHPGTVGFTIHGAVRDPGFVVSLELQGPNGEKLLCRGCGETPVVGEEKPGRSALQMPSTDREGAAIVPGMYRVRLHALPENSPEPHLPVHTRADLFVAMKLESEFAEIERVLDLNFVYLPEIPLNKQIAESSPEFAEILALTEEELAPLGIRFGNVTHVDLDRPDFTHLSSWAEAGRLFRTTSNEVGRPRALNVYCVGVFDGDFLNVGGLSGGIPGPPFNGTRDSGTALRIAPSYPNFRPAYAVLLAHEIGHYLGFYHTTEASLAAEDPLSDTPRCEERDLRECPDWHYHMFPVVNLDHDAWSESQIDIAARHPLVRSIPLGSANDRKEAASEHEGKNPEGHFVGRAVRREGAGTAARAMKEGIPNPFRDNVRFLGLPTGTYHVIDVTGRRVRSLDFNETNSEWDGRDAKGREVPAGVYFVRRADLPNAELVRIVKCR